MYYYRARYYDPAIARFISEDPLGVEVSQNVYAYVRNDPLNYLDPWGTNECTPDQVKGGYQETVIDDQIVCVKPARPLKAIVIEGKRQGPIGAFIYRLLHTEDLLRSEMRARGFELSIARVPSSPFPGSASASAAAEAATLSEQLVMQEARAGAGVEIMKGAIRDLRYRNDWAKMSHVHRVFNGMGDDILIEIHYWKNRATGAVGGFKFVHR